MLPRSSGSVAVAIYGPVAGRWHDQQRELLEVFKARKDHCIVNHHSLMMLVTESPLLPSYSLTFTAGKASLKPNISFHLLTAVV